MVKVFTALDVCALNLRYHLGCAMRIVGLWEKIDQILHNFKNEQETNFDLERTMLVS